MRIALDRLQPLGRALMLPIAVLPIASLLLRLGQPDLLDLPFVAAAGGAIFDNLGLIFAIGVAVGLARENHGAAALAGAVAFLVTTEGAKALLAVPPDVGTGLSDDTAKTVVAAWRAAQLAKLGVPAGILSGLTAGAIYNRTAAIKLPDALAFFGGRRFAPIACGFAGLAGALLFGLGFPLLESAIDALSRWVLGAGWLGLFLYGVLNRLLIVTGLHHILNNLAWFILGDFDGKTGDLNRFFAGDPHAGAFMSGFFPVMMFGLPAACLAMYRTARPERKKAVGGMLLSLSLTSALTGVTEPIEFSFMFLAPLLYALHAVLTGVAMVVMAALDVHLGFGFSAGLLDYLLNYGKATHPLLLLPVGAAYFAIYYAAFSWCIRRFDLRTPGRERDVAAGVTAETPDDRAAAFVDALGGAANLVEIGACTTRLRLLLVDPARVDEPRLTALGARGVVRPGGRSLQVVLGPIADQVAGEMRWAARSPSTHPPAAPPASETVTLAPELVALLGGAGNIVATARVAGRIRVRVADIGLADAGALAAAPSLRGAARVGATTFHLLPAGN